MFDDNSQMFFAFVGFEKYDETVKSYNILSNDFTIVSSFGQTISFNSSINSYVSSRVNFVQFEIVDLLDQSCIAEIKVVKVFLGENSGPNKRAYMNDIEEFNFFLRKQGKQFKS